MARIWLEGELEFDSEDRFEDVWEEINNIAEQCGYIALKQNYGIHVFVDSWWYIDFVSFGKEFVIQVSKMEPVWRRPIEERWS